uniref:RNase H family protein n=1 Tax=Solanum tuberosum TaxID=4113 RepID=M1A3E9_SOLTU
MYIPVKKIQKLIEEHDFTIKHCLSEANQLADKLASIILLNDVNHIFNSFTNISGLVKGPCIFG